MSDENKFHFSEEDLQEQKDKVVEEKKAAVKQDVKGLFESVKKFIAEIFDFRNDTDREATIAAIKNDIPLKGATAWILIFAIFVASIGLNLSSTAVVIGAMLISPLMGPILGVGMSLATNDIDTLKSSFVNLLVMVFLSVLTAYLYFSISPLTELTPELEARTSPNILDVFIAIFGGLALIVARTKKGTIASVIFGVAIATALMPPLCTAGYALAVWNVKFFFGAMYLFGINTTFIALATFVVLKILRFPMLRYVNSKKRKRIAQLAAFFAIIAMIPAVLTFLTLLRETGLNKDYKDFLKAGIDDNEKLWLQKEKRDDDSKTIKLYFNDEINDITTEYLNIAKSKFESIKDYEIIIYGNNERSAEKLSLRLDKAYDNIEKKDNIISGLQKEIEELKNEVSELNNQLDATSGSQNNYSFSNLAKDAKIRFKDLDYFSFGTMLASKDFISVDTLSVAHLKWNNTLSDSLKADKENKLVTWLKAEVKTDSIVVKRNY